MIDLHSHLLPGVDDGSATVEQSVGVLRAMGSHGVTGVCLTPHIRASRVEAGVPPQHDAAFEALLLEAPAEVQLYRGAEVMLDRPLPALGPWKPRLCLGESRYMLVEFPRLVAAETVRNALALVAAIGLVPVLAHPERYSSCSPAAVQWWREAGAKIQVDATTLLAPTARGERARQLLAAGVADILAADNHGDSRALPSVFHVLEEQDARDQAERLMRHNPAAVLADGELTPVEPCTIRLPWTHRIKRLFTGERE